jgi:hypothetical protein
MFNFKHFYLIIIQAKYYLNCSLDVLDVITARSVTSTVPATGVATGVSAGVAVGVATVVGGVVTVPVTVEAVVVATSVAINVWGDQVIMAARLATSVAATE